MPNIKTRHDHGLWLAILKKGFNASGNLKILAKYRHRSGSISFDKVKSAQFQWKLYRQVEKINIDTVGNTVYVLNHMTADNLDTYSMHVFKIRDRKIESFTAYDDTDSMRSSMVK